MEWIEQLGKVIEFLCVYYATVLLRCALISIPVLVLILVLRKTVLKNSVFSRGAVWLILIPVLFTGRMHFYYETSIGVRGFIWTQEFFSRWNWIAVVYMGIAFVLLLIKLVRRIRLNRHIKKLPISQMCGEKISVSDGRHTPFSTGLIRTHIVIPAEMISEMAEEDLSTIITHEKTHIRRGHLWILLAWNIIHCLLWINPLFIIAGRRLREDLELICDRVSIQQTGEDPYEYGMVLMKGLRLIGEGASDSRYPVTFARTGEFMQMKRRISQVSAYRPFSNSRVRGVLLGALLLSVVTVAIVKIASYEKNIPIPGGVIYSEKNPELIVQDTSGRILVGCKDKKIYIDGDELLKNYPDIAGKTGQFAVSIGGYMKLPGMGGGGAFGWLEAGDIHKGVIVIPCVQNESAWDKVIRFF